MEMGLCGGRRHSTHEGQETEWGEKNNTQKSQSKIQPQ